MPLAELVAELVIVMAVLVLEVPAAVVLVEVEAVVPVVLAVAALGELLAVLAAAALMELVAVLAVAAMVELVAVVPAVLAAIAPVVVAAMVPHLHTYSDLFAAASPHLVPDIAIRLGHNPSIPDSFDPSPSPPALLRPSFGCR